LREGYYPTYRDYDREGGLPEGNKGNAFPRGDFISTKGSHTIVKEGGSPEHFLSRGERKQNWLQSGKGSVHSRKKRSAGRKEKVKIFFRIKKKKGSCRGLQKKKKPPTFGENPTSTDSEGGQASLLDEGGGKKKLSFPERSA